MNRCSILWLVIREIKVERRHCFTHDILQHGKILKFNNIIYWQAYIEAGAFIMYCKCQMHCEGDT